MSTYDDLITVARLVELLGRVDQTAKVVLGILTPGGDNPRMWCAVQAVHDDVWKQPTVEIVGKPLPGETR